MFVDKRAEMPSDPSITYTKSGVQGYKADWSLRIEPYMTDCLLSDFKTAQLKDLLIKCP